MVPIMVGGAVVVVGTMGNAARANMGLTFMGVVGTRGAKLAVNVPEVEGTSGVGVMVVLGKVEGRDG